MRISAAGAVRQLKEEELDRSKIPRKARWLISWIGALSELSSDLLKGLAFVEPGGESINFPRPSWWQVSKPARDALWRGHSM